MTDKERVRQKWPTDKQIEDLLDLDGEFDSYAHLLGIHYADTQCPACYGKGGDSTEEAKERGYRERDV